MIIRLSIEVVCQLLQIGFLCKFRCDAAKLTQLMQIKMLPRLSLQGTVYVAENYLVNFLWVMSKK